MRRGGERERSQTRFSEESAAALESAGRRGGSPTGRPVRWRRRCGRGALRSGPGSGWGARRGLIGRAGRAAVAATPGLRPSPPRRAAAALRQWPAAWACHGRRGPRLCGRPAGGQKAEREARGQRRRPRDRDRCPQSGFRVEWREQRRCPSRPSFRSCLCTALMPLPLPPCPFRAAQGSVPWKRESLLEPRCRPQQ